MESGTESNHSRTAELGKEEYLYLILRSKDPPKKVLGLSHLGYPYRLKDDDLELALTKVTIPSTHRDSMLDVTLHFLPSLAKKSLNCKKYDINPVRVFELGIADLQSEIAESASTYDYMDPQSFNCTKSKLYRMNFIDRYVASVFNIPTSHLPILDAYKKVRDLTGPDAPLTEMITKMQEIYPKANPHELSEVNEAFTKIYSRYSKHRGKSSMALHQKTQTSSDENIEKTYEVKDELQKAIMGLTDKRKAVIVDRYYNDKTIENISRNHNVTREQIRQHQQHGLRDLKLLIDKPKNEQIRKRKKGVKTQNDHLAKDQAPFLSKKEWTNIDTREYLNTISHNKNAILQSEKYPNIIEPDHVWLNTIKNMYEVHIPNCERRVLVGINSDKRLILSNTLPYHNKSTEFMSEIDLRRSQAKEFKKKVVGEIVLEPYLPPILLPNDKSFFPMEVVYQFITDPDKLNFKYIDTIGETYLLFRAKDTLKRYVAPNKKDFEFVRDWCYSKLGFTTGGVFNKVLSVDGLSSFDLNADRKKACILLCNTCKLVLYQKQKDDSFIKITN